MTTQSNDTQWFIARDGKQYGPLSEIEMQKLVELGHLKPTDLVWRPGFPEWRPAGSLIPKPAAPAPAPAPSHAPGPATAAPAQQPTTAARAQQSMQPRQPVQQPAPAPAHLQQPQPAAPAPRGIDPMTAGMSAGRAASPSGPAPGQTTGRPAVQPLTPRPAAGPSPMQPQTYQQPQPGSPYAQPAQQPYAMPAPQPVTAGRRPSPAEAAKVPDIASDETSGAPRGRKRAYAAAAIVLMVAAGAGLLLSKKGGFTNLASISEIAAPAGNVAPLGNLSESTASLAARSQGTPLWIAVKKEFPGWYSEGHKEVAKLTAEKQSEETVAKKLAEALVLLRRQNADKALAASTPKLKDVATAFLGNLKALAAKSTDACYNFISQGETSPAVIEMMRSPDQNSPAQMQVAAIFEAIAEGRRSPVTHSAPVKSDYDALADQLTKLGWTQSDLQLFADSKSLAKAKPEKVCRMVQDWFVAHIGIQDAAVQERLLVETLRPVVAG